MDIENRFTWLCILVLVLVLLQTLVVLKINDLEQQISKFESRVQKIEQLVPISFSEFRRKK